MMMLKLAPKYVLFTKKKAVFDVFQEKTKQISLKPTNNITKTKNYFENSLSKYDFFVKDKKNIFAKKEGMNFHFKISLDNFLEIFSKGALSENQFKIYFVFGKEAEWIVSGNSPEYKVIAETVEILKNGNKEAICVLEKNNSEKYFMATYVVVKEEVLVGNAFLEVNKV